jgi:sec-independent protein translocase protein TatB
VAGINGGELLVLLVLVLVVVGPERLPKYAQQLAEVVRGVVGYAKGARDSLKQEMGPEFDDIDWQKLDPRQYDPRRIVREALTDVWDDGPPKPTTPGGPSALTSPSAGAAAGGAAATTTATAGGAAAAAGAAATTTVRSAAGRGPGKPLDQAGAGGGQRPARTPFDPEAT